MTTLSLDQKTKNLAADLLAPDSIYTDTNELPEITALRYAGKAEFSKDRAESLNFQPAPPAEEEEKKLILTSEIDTNFTFIIRATVHWYDGELVGDTVVIKSDRAKVTICGHTKNHRPDCVLVPRDWGNQILKKCPVVQDDQPRALLSSARPSLFRRFKDGGEKNDKHAGERAIKEVLNDLLKPDFKTRIKVEPPKTADNQICESETMWFSKRWYDRWYTKTYDVYTVTALLIIIRLYHKSDNLFAWLVGHSPPSVIVELAKLNGGGLITIPIAKVGIQCLATAIVDHGTFHDKHDLAISGAHIVVSCLRHDNDKISKTKNNKEAQFKSQFEMLVSKIAPGDEENKAVFIRKTGVTAGFVISGVAKYVIEMRQKFNAKKENVKTVLSITFKVLGLVPQAAGLSDILGSALNNAIDRFWQNPTAELPSLVNQMKMKWIDWPLFVDNQLTDVLDPGGRIGKMTREEVDTFREGCNIVTMANELFELHSG